MTFKESQDYVLTFGKYNGETLDQIAGSDEGLVYLDWLYGELPENQTRYALAAYLSDPSIKKELERIP